MRTEQKLNYELRIKKLIRELREKGLKVTVGHENICGADRQRELFIYTDKHKSTTLLIVYNDIKFNILHTAPNTDITANAAFIHSLLTEKKEIPFQLQEA